VYATDRLMRMSVCPFIRPLVYVSVHAMTHKTLPSLSNYKLPMLTPSAHIQHHPVCPTAATNIHH